MKLLDAIKNVRRDSEDTVHSYFDCICADLDISDPYSGELYSRFSLFPIQEWLCTDSHVGYYALYLDKDPIGLVFQECRKCDQEIRWLSHGSAETARQVILSYHHEWSPTITLVDPDKDIEETYCVQYVSQLLASNGFFEGRPVRALALYDSMAGRSTPEEYRRDDFPYTKSVPRGDPRDNHLLVQDGEDTRLIRIRDFHIPYNVTQA